MSEATPMPVEPPGPSTERLADWQALIERIRQGDRAEVLAWDAAAAGPGATYQVLVTQQARQRLRGAPPLLAGSVAGIIAVLRVDPNRGQHDLSPTPAWRCWVDGDLWRRWRVVDLLGPASRADRGAARPDLVWMTDQSGRHARSGRKGSTARSSGTAKRRLLASRHAGCCGYMVDQLLRWRRILSGAKPTPQARCWPRRTGDLLIAGYS